MSGAAWMEGIQWLVLALAPSEHNAPLVALSPLPWSKAISGPSRGFKSSIFQCTLNLILGFMIGYYDKVGIANDLHFIYVAQWLSGTEWAHCYRKSISDEEQSTAMMVNLGLDKRFCNSACSYTLFAQLCKIIEGFLFLENSNRLIGAINCANVYLRLYPQNAALHILN